MAATLSVVVWNLEFRRARSVAGQALRDAVAACEPDIAILTEAYPDSLDLPHRVEPDADHGYAARDGRRKVLLFSRAPWTAVDRLGDPAMPPGRYLAGRTATPAGEVLVHGICIPWSMAHVSTGRRDARPWEEHRRYLDGLARILARPADAPVLVGGDYNQAIPRGRAPRAVHDALLAAFPPSLACATAGAVPPLGRALIDHLHHGPDIAVEAIRALDNHRDGREITDHIGVHAILRRA